MHQAVKVHCSIRSDKYHHCNTQDIVIQVRQTSWHTTGLTLNC